MQLKFQPEISYKKRPKVNKTMLKVKRRTPIKFNS